MTGSCSTFGKHTSCDTGSRRSAPPPQRRDTQGSASQQTVAMWGATSSQVLAMGEYLIDAQVTVALMEAATWAAGSLPQSVDDHALNDAVDRPRWEGVVWCSSQGHREMKTEQLSAHHEGQGQGHVIDIA